MLWILAQSFQDSFHFEKKNKTKQKFILIEIKIAHSITNNLIRTIQKIAP